MLIPTTTLTELILFLISDSALLATCTEDWFTKRFSTFLLLPLGLLHWLSIAPPFTMANLIGTVAFATTYLLPGIGNGDVDWIIICCLALGPQITVPIVLAACLCSLLDPRIRQHRAVPFIPYLCLGLAVVLTTNVIT
ncbi:prepilin peptidase [Limosilactobacillus caecicola]|uniref:prepilin peptidase n=1 Tax=Limosilactobacillus caecicola TaxID=2941332 RepID=UPI00203F38E5|nr:prepilin peptidase [Limosilactobacillus caecicola]